MVPGLSIAFMVVSALIGFGVPTGLFLGLRKRFELKAVPMLVGAAVFVVFALILEQTLHAFVLTRNADGTVPLMTDHPALFVLYAIFAAGIFEETGRLVGFLILRKRYEGVRTGISYGIGHGGIEAILLLGVSMISNIVFSFLINSGTALPAAADTAVDALKTTAPGLFLVGGAERLSAIAMHISLSVIVWMAVTRRGRRWFYPLAIVLHALADLPAALHQAGVLSVWLTETLTALVAAGLLVFAISLIRGCLAEEREQRQQAQLLPPEMPPSQYAPWGSQPS